MHEASEELLNGFSISNSTWRPTQVSVHILCLPHLTLTRTKILGANIVVEKMKHSSPPPQLIGVLKLNVSIWSRDGMLCIHFPNLFWYCWLHTYFVWLPCVYIHTHKHTRFCTPTSTGSDVSIKEFLTPTICIRLLRSKINKYKIRVI